MPISIAVVGVLLALLGGPATAFAVDPVLLEDDFDQENGGIASAETLGYTGWANWDVLDGTVDLVGNGSYDYQPGNGLYVDLDGFTSGTLASKQTFVLEPGEYEVEFDLSGSHRTDVDNSVTVTLGDVFSEDFTLAGDEPFRRIARTIQVAAPTSARLIFTHTSLGDTFGLFLDNVRLAGTALGVASVSPPSGGNAGTVSLVVRGAGFQPGAEVALMDGDQAVLEGRNTLVASRGRVETTFDLRSLTPGPLAVEVRNPDGAAARAPQPFVVEEGGQPALWADILGPPRIRLGLPQTFTVRLGNTGGVDAWGAHVFLRIPARVEYRWIGDESFVSHSSDTIVETVVARVPAGSARSLLLDLRATEADFVVSVAISEDGLLRSRFTSRDESLPGASLTQAGTGLAVGLADYSKEELPPYEEAPTGYVAEFAFCDANGCYENQQAVWVDGDIVWSFPGIGPQRVPWLELTESLDADGFFTWGGFTLMHLGSLRPDRESAMEALLPGIRSRADANGAEWATEAEGRPFCNPVPGGKPCARGSRSCTDFMSRILYGWHQSTWPPELQPLAGRDGNAFRQYWHERSGMDYLRTLARWNVGLPFGGWLSWFERVARALPVSVVAAWDPNEKVGAPGAGEARFIGPGMPLGYEIDFENLAAATAPAREVVITDQLDPAKVDLATLGLGRIAFAGRRVVPPPGTTELATDVDLRPATDLVVRVRAKLDAGTGLLRWRFAAVEPGTGVPPADPVAGFLPPNQAPPEGEGSVSFTVMPQPGLPTGTELSNRASIVFDVNPPIDTGEWLNTVDASPPESRVASLDARQVSPTFEVRWVGVDEGAGVRDYTVYVSEDGGPYSRWLRQTAGTSATFAGRTGHSYRFYTVATDHAGNLEQPPSAPDAVTRVAEAAGGRGTETGEASSGGGDAGGGGPSTAELRADLIRDLRSVVRALKQRPMRRIARRRQTVHRFTPLTAGTMAVSWKAQAAHATARRRSIVIARGKATAPAAGGLTVRVGLTRAGARLISRTRRLPIMLGARFRPASGSAVAATKRVTLRGRPR